MFEKSLSDLVKGIRASKRDTPLYISSCIADIKTELTSTDPYVKCNALQKLTFLQMMGYDMSWANFATIEVMSSTRFGHRRIGYLSACQSFRKETEVILLSTNLFKKELRRAGVGGSIGNNVYDIGMALNCLSNIVTNDLARELLPDVTTLTTNHPSAYIRKKAVLCLFKLFIFYPQGLRLCFDKVQLCLEDSDPSVVSCAVNVITELSDKNPRNYLKLAPVFFYLLTSTVNNWMLIKVVKLLGSLVSEEPRLARKLLDPLVGIVRNTQAKSLLYEAVYTISLALPYCRKADGSMQDNAPDIVKLCGETLASFVRDSDPNLKYLGLVGFGKLVESQGKVLISNAEYRMLVLTCLTDEDDTIRTRALDLLEYMVTKNNLQDLVEQLVLHVSSSEGSYKKEVVAKIIYLCSMDKYVNLTDFAWYIRILLTLGKVRGVTENGIWIQKQMMDVALRVFSVRCYMVRCMMKVLMEEGTTLHTDIYNAVVWVIGEYSHLLTEAMSVDQDDFTNVHITQYHGPYHAMILSLFSSLQDLDDSYTQAMYIQASGKVLASACSQTNDAEIDACLELFLSYLPLLQLSVHCEVQERAFTLYHLLLSCGIWNLKHGGSVLQDMNGQKEDDDLLQMLPSATTTTPAPEKNVASASSKYQTIAPFLTSLFVPEPMKPIPVKAQSRKKSTFTFPDRSNEIYSFWNQSNKNTSFEEISFTTQRRPTSLPYELPGMDSITILSDATSKSSGAPLQPPNTYHNNKPDPFYLPSALAENTQTSTTHPSKFGTIYLNFDTNEEEEVTTSKQKKKKKKKKSKQGESTKSNSTDVDLSIFSNPSPTPQPSSNSSNPVIIYKSDEDEEEIIPLPNTKPSKTHRKHKHKDEFDMLRQVDLTKPLEDNEVMPITQHRQVVQQEDDAPIEIENKKEKKKKKKKKCKEKKKLSDTATTKTVDHATSDLLGFGDDFMTNVLPTPNESTNNVTENINTAMNPINSAFDDLLGLTTSEPLSAAPSLLNIHENSSSLLLLDDNNQEEPPLISMSSLTPMETTATATAISTPEQPKQKNSSKKKEKVWINAIFQSTQSLFSLSFHVHKNLKHVTLQISNHQTIPLQNVSISIFKQSISFGTIAPTSSQQSEKLSVRLKDKTTSSPQYNGSISTSTSTIPFTCIIPTSTLHFNPVNNLTQDQVMKELSSQSNWYSKSCKLPLKGIHENDIIEKFVSFFQAAPVEPFQGNCRILACQGLNCLVRVLLKVSKKKVTVDIKCTEEEILRCLVEDVKRVVLE